MDAVLPLLLVVPWLAFGLAVGLLVRLPRPLAPAPRADGGIMPRASIIVPARNEALNIETCLSSLVAQEYPDFEVIVVNDRSEDGTGELARAVARGNASGIRVLDGQPLPEGWLGKPWACFQGAEAADGDLLLFTDADTTHDPSLLARAVASMAEDEAQAVTVVGRQLMETFWERLIQPQIFFLLGLRYSRLDRPLGKDRAGEAIANGQYILVRRDMYDSVAGHRAVRDEVVEDLRLAQTLCAAGCTLSVREGEDELATRMYRSRRELVDGWGKNLYVGARQSARGRSALLSRLALPGILVFLLGFWVAPPAVLGATLLGAGGAGLHLWAAGTTGFNLIFWTAANRKFRAPMVYAVLYPVGALAAAGIVLRSWIRGGRVVWKGREYQVRVD